MITAKEAVKLTEKAQAELHTTILTKCNIDIREEAKKGRCYADVLVDDLSPEIEKKVCTDLESQGYTTDVAPEPNRYPLQSRITIRWKWRLE